MMQGPSAEEHPRWQVNQVQIRAVLWTGQNDWLSELKVLTLQVYVFLAV